MKQTFVIEVVDQQNASWQGSVKWLNTNKKENFRSALELLRLIDSALMTPDEETQKVDDTG